MSDPIETAVRGLRGQQPPDGFAPVEVVRLRGARRKYRQQLAVAVVVLAVAGGAVTWAGTRTGQHVPPAATSPVPSLTPSNPSSVRPTVVLSSAMFLTAADLGAADWVAGQSTDIGRDPWLWQDICQPFHRADYPSLAERAQVDWRDFSRTSGPGVAIQTIERYAPGAGPSNLDDVRGRLRHCAGMQSPDPRIGGGPRRWTLVADGFAGDDAVLAKCEVFPQGGGPARTSFTVAVRMGDLISTAQLDANTSEAMARAIAAKAAARLR
jgi:hypothetical protein